MIPIARGDELVALAMTSAARNGSGIGAVKIRR